MNQEQTDETKQQPRQIDTCRGVEVAYWSKRLGVSHQMLMDAVQLVGPSVDEVKKYLTEPIQ